ncbi:MAG: hypothetical protein JWM33_1765 [Caulobacteraceae bacterium]|nr:hypothetical protein [Caulobacteraceae bacterium]
MSWHSLKSQVLQRPTYIAAHGSANILAHMLSDLETGRPLKLSILVGHDTNISDLGGTLNLHWQVPSYPADTPPPGGALGFELLRGPGGVRYVRAFYRSQSMDQMRKLTPLAGGAYRQVLPIPGCTQGPEATCPLADFVQLAAAGISTPR